MPNDQPLPPSGNEEPIPKTQNEKHAKNNAGWPNHTGPVFKAGLAVGFVLLLLGGACMIFFPMNWVLEVLVICAGLSIILGAFGSTASVSIPGQSITFMGVAAIAIGLFTVLLNQMSERYVHIKLSGDIKQEQVKSVELIGDREYVGGLLPGKENWGFFIFGKEIKSSKLMLRITLLGDTERLFECIDAGEIVPLLASSSTIEWEYNEAKTTIINTRTHKLVATAVGGCTTLEGTFAHYIPTKRLDTTVSLFPVAYAEEVPENQRVSSAPTEQLIEYLDSDGVKLRRSARDQLGKSGDAVVKPLLDNLAKDDASYRMQLGSLVALSQISRNPNANFEGIKQDIEPADINRLLKAATNDDKTIRVYASEFLYRLEDPRVIEPALENIPSASEDGKYNLLLILSNSLESANEDQKKLVATKIPPLKVDGETKTNSLIDKISEQAAQ
ncbi:hypothetical protein [Pseudomonas lini]|uniref:HEAT repeat domain-containing protein n=1 Tax=Pseudomonas lini TaxID=163011 RepID=A0A0J6K0D6_9PSED|nr:hypothetical protein [Pseudomonas lini]KAB0500890.1 hypothetical protein F7R14_22860 [Pseudomonas lini]KMM89527.1 hypothetical protein TU81_23385 [Pseudomonas lini]SDT00868.1 hypothetical protein SAMN04490191_2906 [Pseudomonas lini]